MKTIVNLGILILLIGVFGCNKDDNNNQAAKPVLSVKLVDAPSSYDAVNVEVIGMEINTGNGWIPLAMDTTGIYNLLEFTNGNSISLVDDTVMNPCTISELRLILGTNNSVVIDGDTFELKTPSGQTSGYKVKMDPQQLAAGGIYRLVLDFNTAKSVHETGNGKYLLKPVVSGYMENTVGGIAGTINPFNGAYYVEAYNATDTAGTYVDAANGQFLISTVLPGTYEVKFFPNPGFTQLVVPNVVVIQGQTTQMGTLAIP